MPRPNIFRDLPQNTAEKIRTRTAWPRALLADVLHCNRTSIYRHFPGPGWIPTHEILSAIAQENGGHQRRQGSRR